MNNVRRAIISGGNGYIGSVLMQALLPMGVQAHAIAHHNRERLDRYLPATHIFITPTVETPSSPNSL